MSENGSTGHSRRPGKPLRIQLIRSDATPRAMRIVDGQLRTRVGYGTMFDPRLETIRITDVVAVEVLAPYAPPTRRMAAIWAGAALGSVAASMAGPQAALVMAVVLATFAAVAAVIGGGANAAYNLARLDLAGGGSRIISYAVEDVEDIRRIFPEGSWREENRASPDVPLLHDEIVHADALRIGLVLGAAGLSLAILLWTMDDPTATAQDIRIPSDVLRYAAISLVAFVAARAWFMMIQNQRRRRRE